MEKQDILSPSIKRDTARSNRVALERTFKYIMSGTRDEFFKFDFIFFFPRTFCFILKFAPQNSEYCMVKREGASLFKIRGRFHQPLTRRNLSTKGTSVDAVWLCIHVPALPALIVPKYIRNSQRPRSIKPTKVPKCLTHPHPVLRFLTTFQLSSM